MKWKSKVNSLLNVIAQNYIRITMMATSKPQELLEIECLEGERNWQIALKLGP